MGSVWDTTGVGGWAVSPVDIAGCGATCKWASGTVDADGCGSQGVGGKWARWSSRCSVRANKNGHTLVGGQLEGRRGEECGVGV